MVGRIWTDQKDGAGSFEGGEGKSRNERHVPGQMRKLQVCPEQWERRFGRRWWPDDRGKAHKGA